MGTSLDGATKLEDDAASLERISDGGGVILHDEFCGFSILIVDDEGEFSIGFGWFHVFRDDVTEGGLIFFVLVVPVAFIVNFQWLLVVFLCCVIFIPFINGDSNMAADFPVREAIIHKILRGFLYLLYSGGPRGTVGEGTTHIGVYSRTSILRGALTVPVQAKSHVSWFSINAGLETAIFFSHLDVQKWEGVVLAMFTGEPQG